jgi:hypothetical protein
MATRRRRRWIAIGGATAAIAIGVWGAVALGAPTGLAVSQPITKAAPHLTWGDSGGTLTSYDVQRTGANCTDFVSVGSATTGSFDDTTLPGDGTYCYQVVGHYSDAPDATNGPASVLYDTTAPAVQITSPANGSVVRGQVLIQAIAPDAGSGLASITLSVDGQSIMQTGPGTAVWNTTTDGTYLMHAVAVDNLGTSATATISVTVDNTAPAAPSVTAVQNPVAGSPTLVWATPPNQTFSVYRNGTLIQDTVVPPWTDPGTLVPGTYDYGVTARDAVGNTSQMGHVSVTVVPPSVTAPRSISANSPTNTVPHVTWQPPVTFAVTGWRIWRDGAGLTTLSDPAAGSFDDTSLSVQGPHTYAVQALSGGTAGDLSSPVSVTYDTMAPALDSATATAIPDGSIAVTWPSAIDPSPGSGLSSYLVRRATGSAGPPDASSGSAVCTLTAPATGCIDASAKNNTLYGYSVFAIDAAGNLARRSASAKAVDSQPPNAVTGLKVVSFDRTYARLGWTVPPAKGADSDIAGYRVLQLRPGVKAPLNPNDGAVVCRAVDPERPLCDALNLATGKKVTFAVYAFDEVPNISAPALISMVPHSVDRKPPHKPTKVKLFRQGLRYTLTWVSPRDLDLSKFRVTLYRDIGRVPSKGRAVVTGRVLHATFKLRAAQIAYVNLFALDVSGNFSRVSKLIVAPDRPFGARSKHKKVAKKKAGAAKTQPKKTKKT